MSLKEDFDAAVKKVNGLPRAPSTGQMLELYGLYKQATAGDATGSRPGMLDVKGRAKYDAWAGRKGMSADDAMTAYLALARKLGA
jgi:diazepam-binding inhibitor (GABA receptor modulator, acyl-CoA-binding protein)